MSLIKKFGSVGSATMASRILGFAREAMIAAFLGAGPVADAFYAAFRFPNLFRRLFAEGAFNSAFIPLFSKELETGGNARAKEFAEQILSVLLLILIVFSIFALLFMPFLVGSIIAPKFAENPEKFDLTVLLTRIMFPYLAAMSLVAMLSGILNAFRKYFLAALAPVILNIVFIAVLVISGWFDLEQRQIGIFMACGVFASGFMQLGLLIYAVRREGFTLSLRIPKISPSVKKLLVLAIPTAIAGGITQINLLVGQIIASAQEGAIAIMNYAERLMQLPLGIIGVSIGVVLLPELTRALAAGDKKEALHLQNRSLEFGLGLTVPAAVGLIMIPIPLISLIYERGAFLRETTELTAQVLAAVSIGLPAYVLIKILQSSFYARQDMKRPMWFAGINALTNIGLSIYLFQFYGVVGIALAGSIAGWLNAFLLGGSLYVGNHLQISSHTWRNIILICLASAIMAGVLQIGKIWLGASLVDSALLPQIALIGFLIGIAVIVYFVIILATGAIPRDQLRRIIRR